MINIIAGIIILIISLCIGSYIAYTQAKEYQGINSNVSATENGAVLGSISFALSVGIFSLVAMFIIKFTAVSLGVIAIMIIMTGIAKLGAKNVEID